MPLGRKAGKAQALRRVQGRAAGEGWWLLQFDGGSRGNPGVAGGGVLLEGPGGRPRVEAAFALGRCSNNVAEYGALLRGLELAVARSAERVQIEGDSLLVVQQLSGAFRITHPDMVDLSARVFAQAGLLQECTVRHIPRKENATADRDATAAKLDAFTKVRRPLMTWRSSTRTSVLRSSMPTNSRPRRRTVRKRTSLH